jgi:hypothetical protein
LISTIGPEGIGTVTLNGSGNGTARVGPLNARETWHPENVHVSVASNVNEATCAIYVGDAPIQQNFRDATFTGSSGDSTDKVGADTVGPNVKIWAVWSGGDAGAQAVIRVTGTKDI